MEEDLMEDVFSRPQESPRLFRFSPRKSLSVSPKKRKPSGRMPADVDESSIDIYGDLSMDTVHFETHGETSTKEQTTCDANDAPASSNMDLFTEVLVNDLTEKEKLECRIKHLEEQNCKLLSENQSLQKCKEQVSKNISSLFLTAKLELQQKADEIERLRNLTVELFYQQKHEHELLFNRNTVGQHEERGYIRTQSSSGSRGGRASSHSFSPSVDIRELAFMLSPDCADKYSGTGRHSCKVDSKSSIEHRDRWNTVSKHDSSEQPVVKGKDRLDADSGQNLLTYPVEEREKSDANIKGDSRKKPVAKESERVNINSDSVEQPRKEVDRLIIHSDSLKERNKSDANSKQLSAKQPVNARDKSKIDSDSVKQSLKERSKSKIDSDSVKQCLKERDKSKIESDSSKKPVKQKESSKIDSDSSKKPVKEKERSKIDSDSVKKPVKEKERSKIDSDSMKKPVKEKESSKFDSDPLKKPVKERESSKIDSDSVKHPVKERDKSKIDSNPVKKPAKERESSKMDSVKNLVKERDKSKIDSDLVKKPVKEIESSKIDSDPVKKHMKEREKSKIDSDSVKKPVKEKGSSKIDSDSVKHSSKERDKSKIDSDSVKKPVNERESLNIDSVSVKERDGTEPESMHLSVIISHENKNKSPVEGKEHRQYKIPRVKKLSHSTPVLEKSSNLTSIFNQNNCNNIDSRGQENPQIIMSNVDAEEITNSDKEQGKNGNLSNQTSDPSHKGKELLEKKDLRRKEAPKTKLSIEEYFEREDLSNDKSEPNVPYPQWPDTLIDKSSHTKRVKVDLNLSDKQIVKDINKRFTEEEGLEEFEKRRSSDATIPKQRSENDGWSVAKGDERRQSTLDNPYAPKGNQVERKCSRARDLKDKKILGKRFDNIKAVDSKEEWSSTDVYFNKGKSLNGKDTTVADSKKCRGSEVKGIQNRELKVDGNVIKTVAATEDRRMALNSVVGNQKSSQDEFLDLDIGSADSILDRSSGSEHALMIFEDANSSGGRDPRPSSSPRGKRFHSGVESADLFASYKEDLTAHPNATSLKTDPHCTIMLTRRADKADGSNSPTITALPNITSSNQDWSNMASIVSLPFSNIVEDKSFPQPPSPSNHTWPFKVSDSSHNPIPEKSNSELPLLSPSSSSSSSNCLKANVCKKITNASEMTMLSKATCIEGTRAFPINKLQPTGTASPLEPKKTTLPILPQAGTQGIASFEADNMASESSGSSEKSSESSEKSSSETNQKRLSHPEMADDANLTPPRIRKPKLSTTPSSKLSTMLSSFGLSPISPTPRRSTKIMCTPNLIVLGDEEATSGTLISPCKSASEFYPPGVRMKLQEVSTHRHIRGEPELLHAGSSDTFGNALDFGNEAPSADSFKGAYPMMHGNVLSLKERADLSESTSNSSSETTSEEQNRERSSNEQGCTDGNQTPFSPLVKEIFKNVFKKSMFAFKEDMAQEAAREHELLTTKLRQTVVSLRNNCSQRDESMQTRRKNRRREFRGSRTRHKNYGRVDSFSDSGKPVIIKEINSDRLPSKRVGKIVVTSPKEVIVNSKSSESVNLSGQEAQDYFDSTAINLTSRCPLCCSTSCSCVGLGLNTGASYSGGLISRQFSGSKDSSSQDSSASSSRKQLNHCKFSFFVGKSSHLPSSTRYRSHKNKRLTTQMTVRDDIAQSSTSSSSRNSEDAIIDDIVSSLDTNWKDAIEKDFKEKPNVNLQDPLTVFSAFSHELHMSEDDRVSLKSPSFAGKIPSSFDGVSREHESGIRDPQTTSFSTSQGFSKTRQQILSPLDLRTKVKRPKHGASVTAGNSDSPDACAVTSSDVLKENIHGVKQFPTSFGHLSPFDGAEPDSTSEPFPRWPHQASGHQHTFVTGDREAEVTPPAHAKQYCRGRRNAESVQSFEPEQDRLALPDSPQKESGMSMTKAISATPKSSLRRNPKATKGSSVVPRANLFLNKQLFPVKGKEEASCSSTKLQTTSERRNISNNARNCSESSDHIRDIAAKEEYYYGEGEGSMNATFTVLNNSFSDEEDGDITLTQEQKRMTLSANSNYMSPSGLGEGPFHTVDIRQEYLPSPLPLDELSLDARSLSEFDQDVIRSKQVKLQRVTSRTCSFSSLISVGLDSPRSVSSHRLSMPASHRSPRDGFLSPIDCKTLDSYDDGPEEISEMEDSFTSVQECSKESERVDTKASLLMSEEIKLSRHMSFQELYAMLLVKRNPTMHHSPEVYDCGDDDDDDTSETTSSEGGKEKVSLRQVESVPAYRNHPEDPCLLEEKNGENDHRFTNTDKYQCKNERVLPSEGRSIRRHGQISPLKSVKIAELLPIENIVARSPSRQADNNFILKRLSPLVKKSTLKITQSPLKQKSCFGEKQAKEISTRREKFQATTASSSGENLNDRHKERRGTADEQALSWATAHRKSVDRVKLKLSTRLDNSEKAPQDFEISHFSRAVKTATCSLLEKGTEKSKGELSKCSNSTRLGVSVPEEFEDGEILDDSVDNIFETHDHEMERHYCDQKDTGIGSKKNKSPSRDTTERQAKEDRTCDTKKRPSDQFRLCNRDKPMPKRKAKNFGRMSGSGHGVSPLSQARRRSPSRKPMRFDELAKNDRDGNRKRLRSPSPASGSSFDRFKKKCFPERRSSSFDREEGREDRGRRERDHGAMPDTFAHQDKVDAKRRPEFGRSSGYERRDSADRKDRRRTSEKRVRPESRSSKLQSHRRNSSEFISHRSRNPGDDSCSYPSRHRRSRSGSDPRDIGHDKDRDAGLSHCRRQESVRRDRSIRRCPDFERRQVEPVD